MLAVRVCYLFIYIKHGLRRYNTSTIKEIIFALFKYVTLRGIFRSGWAGTGKTCRHFNVYNYSHQTTQWLRVKVIENFSFLHSSRFHFLTRPPGSYLRRRLIEISEMIQTPRRHRFVLNTQLVQRKNCTVNSVYWQSSKLKCCTVESWRIYVILRSSDRL